MLLVTEKRYRYFLVILLSGISCLPVNAEPLVKVKTARLSDIAIYPGKSAPATVISLNNTTLSTQIQARVEKIHVRVGDIVDKDKPLVSLDCSDYRLRQTEYDARIESLRAQIELAKKRLERTEELLKKRSIAEEMRDERISALAVLKANLKAGHSQLKAAKLDVERCLISSPFYALIVERTGSVGQFAKVGTSLLEIVDLDQLEVSGQIFNRDALQLAVTDEIFFEFDGVRYPLTLRTIVTEINSETRNREVRLLFKDQSTLPGSAGKLFWKDTQMHIPAAYLVNREGAMGVFYINDEDAHFHALPDARTGRTSLVDLPGDARIVIEGHYALQDSISVQIIE